MLPAAAFRARTVRSQAPQFGALRWLKRGTVASGIASAALALGSGARGTAVAMTRSMGEGPSARRAQGALLPEQLPMPGSQAALRARGRSGRHRRL
jgi:hypothetical protein